MTKTCGDCGAFAHPGQCNAVAYLNHQLARERTAREAAEKERDEVAARWTQAVEIGCATQQAHEGEVAALRAELEKAREENTRLRGLLERYAATLDKGRENILDSNTESTDVYGARAAKRSLAALVHHTAETLRSIARDGADTSDRNANRKPEPTP